MKALFSILLLFVGAFAAAEDIPEEHVTLVGVVAAMDFPGPPNYESIANGDARETYWILTLESPLADGSRDVQLVLTPDQYQRYRPLLGTRVSATGSLIPWETAHHKTPWLLQVMNLGSAP